MKRKRAAESVRVRGREGESENECPYHSNIYFQALQCVNCAILFSSLLAVHACHTYIYNMYMYILVGYVLACFGCIIVNSRSKTHSHIFAVSRAALTLDTCTDVSNVECSVLFKQ